MARKALFVALSSKVADRQVIFLDKLILLQAKTREMAQVFKNISKLFPGSKMGNTLLVIPTLDKMIALSARNLPDLYIAEVRNLNALDVLSHKNLIMVKDAVNTLENNKQQNANH